MKKRKTIEELYQEVKGADLVIVPDAALAEALNRRVETPRIGPFADTLKNHVIKARRYNQNDTVVDEQEVVRRLSKDLGYKKAHYFVSLLKECWMQKGEIDKRLSPVPEFISIPEKVHEALHSFPFYYSLLEDFSFDSSLKVTVIEKQLFEPFEQIIFTDSVRKISLFSVEESEFPGFSLFENPHDLIAAVAGEITKENQQQIGIVTSSEGVYSNVLKAMIRSKGIAIIGPKDIMEDIPFRRALAILRMSFEPDRLTVKDAAGFLNEQGVDVSRDLYSYFLKDYPEDRAEGSGVKDFYSRLKEISGMTFREFSEKPYAGDHMRDIVQAYRFEDRVVLDSFNDFEYLLSAFGREIDSSRKGVIFADAATSLIVDRPIVFYLMPDNTWISDSFQRLWLDKRGHGKGDPWRWEDKKKKLRDLRSEKHGKQLLSFSSLIQSGRKRYFMACPRQKNREAVPCYYFQELGLPAVPSFRDDRIPFRWFTPAKKLCGNMIGRKESSGKSHLSRTLSNSVLKAYMQCPRKYSLGRVVSEPRQEHMERGRLIHQFAEFYLRYPALVKRKGPDFFVEMMTKEMNPLVEGLRMPTVQSFFAEAVENIISYIDKLVIRKVDVFPEIKRQHRDDRVEKNIFLEKLEQEVAEETAREAASERDAEDCALRMNGRIDLVISEQELTDFKSSLSSKGSSEIIRNSDTKDIRYEVDFQCKFYLALLRARCPGKKLKLLFYYPLALLQQKMAGNTMKEQPSVSEVVYYPVSFREFTATRECFDMLCATSAGRDDFLSRLGYEEYSNIGSFSLDFDAADKDTLSGSAEAGAFEERCIKAMGKDTVRNRNDAIGVVRTLYDIRYDYLFKEDLDEFEKFVVEKHEDIKACFEKGFPPSPRYAKYCSECSFNNICEMRLSFDYDAE